MDLQFKILFRTVIKYFEVIFVMFVKLLNLITINVFKVAQTLFRATGSLVWLSLARLYFLRLIFLTLKWELYNQRFTLGVNLSIARLFCWIIIV